jgi:nicotinamide-nucleotide amidase
MSPDFKTSFKEMFEEALDNAPLKMERAVARLLHQTKSTISVAESVTGGLICGRLTATPGSSEYFVGGIVAYHPRIKAINLGIDPKIIAKHGVVSEPVAGRMACGIREIFKTTLGLSSTGLAGPALKEGEPVGLTFLGLATAKEVRVKKFIFEGTRDEIRFQASQAALALVWLYLGGGHP